MTKSTLAPNKPFYEVSTGDIFICGFHMMEVAKLLRTELGLSESRDDVFKSESIAGKVLLLLAKIQEGEGSWR